MSSARRSGPKENPVLPFAVVLVALTIILVVVFGVRDRDPESHITQPMTPTTPPQPSPTPTSTPTPRVVKHASDWVAATVILPPSPTPAVPSIEAYPTRAPRPSPSISQCAQFSWSTIQVFSPSAQVKVDIRVRNRCPYDLGPANLWFEITGWRDGGRVRSVRGHPFEIIRRDRTGDLSIGLPGSLDWYDEIEVTVSD